MISPETISLVRDRTDIVAVISESVPSLKRFGRIFKACCPFHKEKTPSFNVNPDRQWFHCFGCGEHGSAIDFLMKNEGYTFPEAVRSLAERAGIVIEEERGSVDREAADRQKKQKDDLYSVNHLAATFFEQQLQSHPMKAYAEAELARRGLQPSDEVVQAFRIGYAPPGWDGLTTFLKAQGVSPVAGEAVGLLVPRSSGTGYYDRFRHRLMFAVVDAQGRVIAFSGRSLPELPEEGRGEKRDSDDRKADPPPKYINSPESPIYTKGNALFGIYQARHAIRTEESAILVEGNFDVVSLHARGVTNAIAPLGTAFTADQARLMKRYAPSVTILFDGDAAGRKATLSAREPCKQAGISARVAVLPDGVDPDDLSRREGGVDALKSIVAGAHGIREYVIDTLLDESFAGADAYERSARVDTVAKLMVEDDDFLVRSMLKTHVDRLSARLDLHGLGVGRDDARSSEPFRALGQAVKKAVAALPPKPPPESSAMSTELPGRARIAHRPPGQAETAEIVGAIIEYPALLDDSEVQSYLDLLEGPSAQTVAAVAKSRLAGVAADGKGEKALDTTVFLAQIPSAIQAFASKRLAAPRHDSIDLARGGLLDNGAKLRRLRLAREAEDIAREQYKAAGDWQVETELAREAQERVRQKHGLKRQE